MEKIEKFVSKQENIVSIIAVINIVCEYSEKEVKSGEERLHYAVRMFHVFAKELYKREKISQELYEECEKLTEDQVEKYINDVISIWNRSVSLLKKLKRFLRNVKYCKK